MGHPDGSARNALRPLKEIISQGQGANIGAVCRFQVGKLIFEWGRLHVLILSFSIPALRYCREMDTAARSWRRALVLSTVC